MMLALLAIQCSCPDTSEHPVVLVVQHSSNNLQNPETRGNRRGCSREQLKHRKAPLIASVQPRMESEKQSRRFRFTGWICRCTGILFPEKAISHHG